MSKQVVSRSKSQSTNVNILDMFKGNTKGRKKGNAQFVIPAMFFRFTPDGLQIGTAPQQETLHPEVAKVVRRSTKTSHRGRVPGNYVATDKSTTDAKLTDSMHLIHNTLATRKRGLTAMQLAERLDMPMGTVGWALTRMQERGVVAHAKEKKTRAAKKAR